MPLYSIWEQCVAKNFFWKNAYFETFFRLYNFPTWLYLGIIDLIGDIFVYQ